MSLTFLNQSIRKEIVAVVAVAGTVPTKSVIDQVVASMQQKRVTRQRIAGNISALCCKFNRLSCKNSSLSLV